MIDRGISFQLVSWQPVFEKRIISQCIASIVRNACGVKSWFGRQPGADRDGELCRHLLVVIMAASAPAGSTCVRRPYEKLSRRTHESSTIARANREWHNSH